MLEAAVEPFGRPAVEPRRGRAFGTVFSSLSHSYLHRSSVTSSIGLFSCRCIDGLVGTRNEVRRGRWPWAGTDPLPFVLVLRKSFKRMLWERECLPVCFPTFREMMACLPLTHIVVGPRGVLELVPRESGLRPPFPGFVEACAAQGCMASGLHVSVSQCVPGCE